MVVVVFLFLEKKSFHSKKTRKRKTWKKNRLFFITHNINCPLHLHCLNVLLLFTGSSTNVIINFHFHYLESKIDNNFFVSFQGSISSHVWYFYPGTKLTLNHSHTHTHGDVDTVYLCVCVCVSVRGIRYTCVCDRNGTSCDQKKKKKKLFKQNKKNDSLFFWKIFVRDSLNESESIYL